MYSCTCNTNLTDDRDPRFLVLTHSHASHALVSFILLAKIILPLPEKLRVKKKKAKEKKKGRLVTRLTWLNAKRVAAVGVTDEQMGKFYVVKLAAVELFEVCYYFANIFSSMGK